MSFDIFSPYDSNDCFQVSLSLVFVWRMIGTSMQSWMLERKRRDFTKKETICPDTLLITYIQSLQLMSE